MPTLKNKVMKIFEEFNALQEEIFNAGDYESMFFLEEMTRSLYFATKNHARILRKTSKR